MAYHGKPLSAKHKLFVEEYLRNGENGTQAAIAVGYSETSAAKMACKILQQPNVADHLARRRKSVAKAAAMETDEIAAELAKLARSKITDVMSWDAATVTLKPSADIPEDAAAAIESVEQTMSGLKVKMHSKKGALDSLARINGAFKDNLNVGGDLIDQLRAKMAADDDSAE